MKFFLYDETMMNTKAKITTEKLSAMSDIVSQKAQYITAAGAATPNQITIAAGVLIAVGSSVFKTVLTNLTTANLDTGSGFEMGTDYYIYCCDPTNGSDTVDRDEVFVISKNSLPFRVHSRQQQKDRWFPLWKVSLCERAWKPDQQQRSRKRQRLAG